MVAFTKNVLITLTLALIGNAMSIPHEKREDGGIKVDFTVERLSRNETTAETKRSFTAPLSNKVTTYKIPLSIGSNKDEVSLVADTGSADTWVISPSTQCTAIFGGCSDSGTYDPSKSSTTHDIGKLFKITYGDHSVTEAEFYTDDVDIGGVTVKQLQIGVATTSSVSGGGILGLGYENLESPTANNGDPTYVNFPIALKNQGLISSAYYSIYLNSTSAQAGSIIFGGSDSSKYTGPLQVAPFDSPKYFFVKLNHLSPDGGDTIEGNYDVLLDSGTTESFLPQDTVDKIASYFPGAEKNPFSGSWVVDPNQIPSGNLKFSFDGTNYILIPFKALVALDNSLQVNPPTLNTNILGDVFLRYAYVIFDLDKKQASIAQAKFD